MNEAVMVGRIKEASPRFMARMAGVFYLMDFAFAPAMFAGPNLLFPEMPRLLRPTCSRMSLCFGWVSPAT